MTVVAWIGALTALLAAVIAATQYDIKRVLAYSTISQLGYMFLANGVGAFSVGIFHLITHAFFKALMFMGAGSVMHALANETDMRKMGGLRKLMPITGWTFMAGWLAICGIFPFAGFFSKDAILASAWAEGEYVLWAHRRRHRRHHGVLHVASLLPRLRGATEAPGGHAPTRVTVDDVGASRRSRLSGPWGPASSISPEVLTLEHFLEPVLGESALPEGLSEYVLAGIALLVALARDPRSALLLSDAVGYRPPCAAAQGKLARPPDRGVARKFWVDEIYGSDHRQAGAATLERSPHTRSIRR